jgi:hypothetical protein
LTSIWFVRKPLLARLVGDAEKAITLTRLFSRAMLATAKEKNGENTVGTARDVVGIWRGAISGNMKVSFQAARSIG